MRNFLDHHFSPLISLIYEAALDPRRWQAVLDALPASFGGAYGIFYRFNREFGRHDWALHCNCDPSYAASYAAHYADVNPYPLQAIPLYRPGVVTLATCSISKEVVEATEFYNDWMRPQRIPADHFGAALLNDEEKIIVLGLAPDAVMYQRHRDGYERQLKMLVPHLLRALDINRRLDAGDAMRRGAAVAIESLSQAAFFLSAAGRPVMLNDKAETLLLDPKGALSVDRFGRLTTRGGSAALDAALRRGIELGEPAGPIEVKAADGSATLLTWIVPVPAPSSAPAPVATSVTVRASETPRVLLLAASAKQADSIPAAAIASIFHLTAAESRLAAAIVSGMTLIEYAAHADLSRHTVRNQLASVFAKTGLRRQTELVAAIVRALGSGR